MRVYINDKGYNVNNLEEINTLVPPEEIVKLDLSLCNITELPENIFQYNTNLQTLYLHNNNLTQLPENVFKYNTKLVELCLTQNWLTVLPENIFKYNTGLNFISIQHNILKKLPENIFKFNTNLLRVYLYSNNLIELPENIFKYNTKLELLYLDYNKLTELPENIFKYNTKLELLNLGYNKLTKLSENILRYNTNLYVLYLNTNDLTELPNNIFTYHTNLEWLILNNNNFTVLPENIVRYNTNLVNLFLNNNKLKKLPISLLNCYRLKVINYEDNEIDYIPPNIQRFLNRIINQSNDLQIYNDGQNVHNHEIQESVKNSIDNILSIPKTIEREKIMQYIVDSKMTETSKRLLFEYCNDTTVHTVLNVTFEEVLQHMFQYIVDHLPDKLDDIMSILDNEMQDSDCKCFTGRISRLINCLGGISDLVEVKIPENMERSNIVLMLRNKYSGQELIDHITKEFTERGYQEHIQEYIEAL